MAATISNICFKRLSYLRLFICNAVHTYNDLPIGSSFIRHMTASAGKTYLITDVNDLFTTHIIPHIGLSHVTNPLGLKMRVMFLYSLIHCDYRGTGSYAGSCGDALSFMKRHAHEIDE